jgi:hypothetical protein
MPESRNLSSALFAVVRDSANHASFPDSSVDYVQRFGLLDEHLNTHVHPHSNTGPSTKEDIWLTDHGPLHISTVIRRAGDLTVNGQNQCCLSPYECYILLLACHFHDVGNIFGRVDHEKKARELMFTLNQTLVGSDSLEKRLVCDIALAHGGEVDNVTKNKDTIGSLPYDPQSKTNRVGVKKLAAILRFADEIADDKTRTNQYLEAAVAQNKPGSKLYHAYAKHLRPVEVRLDERSVDLHFELTVADMQTTFPTKSKGDTFLFEEILERTLKMHRERVYCSRFMIPYVYIDQINVSIDVCSNDYSQVLGMLKYVLRESGYPNSPSEISRICPELNGLSGAQLAAQVAELNPKPSQYSTPVDLLASQIPAQVNLQANEDQNG